MKLPQICICQFSIFVDFEAIKIRIQFYLIQVSYVFFVIWKYVTDCIKKEAISLMLLILGNSLVNIFKKIDAILCIFSGNNLGKNSSCKNSGPSHQRENFNSLGLKPGLF